MSTGCEFYGDALVELARGELEPGRVERLEAHLETCDACRAELAVIRAVRQSPARVPQGLDARIRAAVADRVAVGPAGSTEPTQRPVAGSRSRSPWQGWRIWALPAAAAAALTLWVGGALVLPSDGNGPEGTTTELPAEYDAYGVWPEADGVVAGDVVLSELTVEELEALLEEMQ